MVETYDKMAKIVSIGDPGTGKSNIINRFGDSPFNESSRSTIGVEFMSK